jgi:hypothetical protein
VFDKIKNLFNDRLEVARDMRAHPGPADLAAIPPDTAAIGGLGAVPTEVVGAYVGLGVKEIRPLDALGPESSGLIGNKIRSRMREHGMDDPNLEPGEIVAGQNEARLARFREQGMTEEQIAEIQAKIGEMTTERQKDGWTVEFVNGNIASVQLFDLDSDDSQFTRLKATFDYQHTKAGAEYHMETLTDIAVDRLDNSPYETYYLPGKLASRGRSHQADAIASHLGVMNLDQTLAALAIIALHSLEG